MAFNTPNHQSSQTRPPTALEILSSAEKKLPLHHVNGKFIPRPKASGQIVLGSSSSQAPMREEEKDQAVAEAQRIWFFSAH